MPKPRNYTIEEFKSAIQTTTSIRQALKLLGVKEAGGNYSTAKRLIKELNLDVSHHLPYRNANKGKKFGPKRPLSEYLSNKRPISSHSLKLRLLNAKVFEPICSSCSQSVWLEQPIPLELDHINGNHDDNQLSNLRLLCPNCHALTSNYRGKNIKCPERELNPQSIEGGSV